ncbi:hypothetical protein F4778DRAFT_782313 [Xylariomycetidae sp. FL2044]|nr:hypothetical protein F4778DRAFT_782313 [Xylariomycetidae sp. FL2044]
MDPNMCYTYPGGSVPTYGDSRRWPMSTAMTRGQSFGSASSHSSSGVSSPGADPTFFSDTAVTSVLPLYPEVYPQSNNYDVYSSAAETAGSFTTSPTVATADYMMIDSSGGGVDRVGSGSPGATMAPGTAAGSGHSFSSEAGSTWYQYYDFVTGDERGQGPYWRIKAEYRDSSNYPEMMPCHQDSSIPRSTGTSGTSGTMAMTGGGGGNTSGGSSSSSRNKGTNNKNRNAASTGTGTSPTALTTTHPNTDAFVCLQANCPASPFKRKADLQRHYRHKHQDVSTLEAFPCDYRKCARHREPFFRLDHCRDHYREFHLDDVLKRQSHSHNGHNSHTTSRNNNNKKKNTATASSQKTTTMLKGGETPHWWKIRYVDPRWFRCAKCLGRVDIASEGWECPRCRTVCEVERRELRGYGSGNDNGNGNTLGRSGR